MDVCYIKHPRLPCSTEVLHVVDEATRFQTGLRLQDLRAETVWIALRRCWTDTYLGPPDILVHDAGSNFLARSFQENAGLLSIEYQSVPIEAANAMSFVERYHQPVRRAFKVIADDCLTL